MKKNVAALVFGILGAISGLIGAIMWAACARTCAGFSGAMGGRNFCPHRVYAGIHRPGWLRSRDWIDRRDSGIWV